MQHEDFDWTEEYERAYRYMVHAISSNPLPFMPDCIFPFEPNTDVFRYETGTLLYQKYSKNPAQKQLLVVC